MNSDSHFMNRCLELARKGNGHVAPNPLVGAVIVHNGKVIGEGHHEKYGQAHAEVNAVNSVKDQSLFSEATIYVSPRTMCSFRKNTTLRRSIVASQFFARCCWLHRHVRSSQWKRS